MHAIGFGSHGDHDPGPRSPRRRLLLAALPALAAPALGAHAAPPADAGFDFTDTQGRRHSLARHAGRWVLLNLWATWCTPCLAEMPELQALSRDRADLVVIGLAVDGLLNPARMGQFAARVGVTYPLVAGDMEMASPFKARVVPTTLLWNPKGQRVLFKEGRITRQEMGWTDSLCKKVRLWLRPVAFELFRVITYFSAQTELAPKHQPWSEPADDRWRPPLSPSRVGTPLPAPRQRCPHLPIASLDATACRGG